MIVKNRYGAKTSQVSLLITEKRVVWNDSNCSSMYCLLTRTTSETLSITYFILLL